MISFTALYQVHLGVERNALSVKDVQERIKPIRYPHLYCVTQCAINGNSW